MNHRNLLVLTISLLAAACTNLPEGPVDLVQANVVQDECGLFDGTGPSATPAGWSFRPEFLPTEYDEALIGVDPTGKVVVGMDPELGDYVYTGARKTPSPCLSVDGADGRWTGADFGVDDDIAQEFMWSQFAQRNGSTLLLALDYSYYASDDRCDGPPEWGTVPMPEGGCTTTVLLTLEW